jgi:hypothetical protein
MHRFGRRNSLVAASLAKRMLAIPSAATSDGRDGEHQQLHGDETCVCGDLVCGHDGATEEMGFLRFAVTEAMFISAAAHANGRRSNPAGAPQWSQNHDARGAP